MSEPACKQWQWNEQYERTNRLNDEMAPSKRGCLAVEAGRESRRKRDRKTKKRNQNQIRERK